MADASLDDFFAKKDKNRKKSKAKSLAAGDPEDSTKILKKEKKKKDKEKAQQNSGGGTLNLDVVAYPQEDEEWKDFEEEKKADYTGLRIQNMQIASKEEQDKEAADAEEELYDEDGECRERKDGSSGPWNKNSVQDRPAPVKANPEPVPETVKEEPAAPKAPSKYVPPAQRYAAQTSSNSASFPTSRRKKEAPNLHSEEDFPTLGGGVGGDRGYGQYSSTASSDLIDHTNQRKGVNLTLENKFSALQD